MKFTKHTAGSLSLPAGKADHFVWDDDVPGFGVRLRGSVGRTSATWVVQGRYNGGTRRESLGDVRKITLEDARTAARKWFAKVELGVDPAERRMAAKAQAAVNKLTLANVAARYLDAKRDRLRPNTFKAATVYLTRHWQPLRNKPIDSIKRADVAARLHELVKERGRTSAARARDYLRAMFAWAMKEGLCEANPIIATNDPAEGIPARDRVLSDDEIRSIWNACRDNDFGRIIKLLLLTGCRREEIGALKWSEVDLNIGVLTIPGSRTKNHKTHELTLPPVALDLLQSAPRRANREHVFGTGGRGGFGGYSYSTIRLNGSIIEAEGKALASWRLHDLRRTFRTGLGKIGIAPHIAELCINHVKGGVEAIYDRHKYEREIKAALALWADHVQSIVEGVERKVVALRTGDISEHALAFGHGPGANGKSTFINVLRHILGDYATVAPIETFTASQTDRHPTDLAMLRGARLVIASETESGRKWAESKIKALTGGDPISARFMRQDFFEYQPQFKLMIVGNSKPALTSVNEAMRRRFHLIPFTVTIPPADRDPNLPDKLKQEAGGILRWMVEGCLEWQKHGLSPPAAVQDATASYLSDEDAIGLWLADCCEAGTKAEHHTATRSLYRSWLVWCEKAGETVGSERKFSQALVGREVVTTTGKTIALTRKRLGREQKGPRGFVGLRLLWDSECAYREEQEAARDNDNIAPFRR